MQETSRYAVGIDIGTTTVRCVVGHIDSTTGTPTIVGVGQAPNTGMRKGVVANLSGPAQAIDDALGEAERMSGYQVDSASISINGSHIISTKADGMIAVGGMDHEIVPEDLDRIEEVATMGKVPPNREILEVVPHSYRLDGQDNIKDPLGMTGTRLEINANVVSALAPHLSNLQKSAEMAKVTPHAITPAVLAASKAVLGEHQIENGVAVVDLGGSTTSVAVFEEGDLQYMAVIPVGGANITNDLAIGLKTDPEIAEKVKVTHAAAVARSAAEDVTVKHDKETHTFSSSDIDEIVEARLDEIFEAVHKELKKAGRAGQLPSGVVLTGGTAKLKGIADYAKAKLELAARVGKSSGYGGVAENIEEPQFATVVGLMLADAQGGQQHAPHHSAKTVGGGGKAAIQSAGGFISKFINKFKA
ncbi:MAG TPA: cell division protein FtsA [Candidatus Saccharimonadales bacterium]